MHYRFMAAAATTLLLAASSTASAGAPNYDCYVTGGGRVTIDQWSGVVATSGISHQQTRWGLMGHIDQAGPRLDLTATLRGTPVTIAVRGTGSSMKLTERHGTLQGHCVLVPGFFIVRRADSGGTELRTGPAATAKRVLRIHVGAPIWQDSRRQPSGLWLPVHTLIVQRGVIRAVDGWLRQARPPISRDIAGSAPY